MKLVLPKGKGGRLTSSAAASAQLSTLVSESTAAEPLQGLIRIITQPLRVRLQMTETIRLQGQ
ncbi:hypothetical protein H681_17660 [Pseudomonas sp. ATCC 13867]|nr:hypothetical protein H681_17660 [Pseudomonas sp. ATCC 13867]